MKKITFIIHGQLRRRNSLTEKIHLVFGKSFEPDFKITTHRGHAIELSSTAVKEGSDCIICVGGDGTLNEVVNGVMQASPETEKRKNIRVGLLPYGTGNDFSRSVTVTRSFVTLLKYIVSDHYREIDLGEAFYVNRSGSAEKRFFINITDVGIGGYIVRLLDSSSKRFGSFITYQTAIIRAFFRFRKQPLKVWADGWEYEGKAMELLVANGKYIGGGLCIAPGARPDDGKFLVALGGDISLWDYLKNLHSIWQGEEIDHPEAYYHSAEKVRVDSLTTPLPIDMDGDFVGFTPLEVSILPKAIRFIC